MKDLFKLLGDIIKGIFSGSKSEAEKYPTLNPGMTGDFVKLAQERLKVHGFFTGTPLGNFKDLTSKAAVAFKQANGLGSGAIIDDKTWTALLKDPTVRVIPNLWKPHKYHPIENVPAPYTHLHPYDFICTFALGQKEIPGSKHNELLAHTHEHCANLGTHSDDKNDYADEVPYCSSGLNWTADGTGCEKTDHALASSWDKYVGRKLKKGDKVRKGDIIRLSNSNHVTIANKDFTWTGTGTFEGLGFNQGNMVKVSQYSQTKIVTIHEWALKTGTVLRPIQLQAKLGSVVANESTR